ncbi:hypothetical protein HanXRQr2_Chr12g0532311 [Helianthus annuus]|uniref:Uncharacterized protein n=1 Tax=Helianthus annuus TaxID=4232 RepID=A0A9K3HF40_HELAN|nr:hypothetical protein HanXRQr2_Chr12g0532311 [Helianthus annuus]KAJ0674303.1 hypothetical protein HanLR1_Chr12g0438481 [Helianthus annuus]KAJ0861961.1 hypothetical protein HanPSC8_Chr12g0512681 [Helianthus annuus]
MIFFFRITISDDWITQNMKKSFTWNIKFKLHIHRTRSHPIVLIFKIHYRSLIPVCFLILCFHSSHRHGNRVNCPERRVCRHAELHFILRFNHHKIRKGVDYVADYLLLRVFTDCTPVRKKNHFQPLFSDACI